MFRALVCNTRTNRLGTKRQKTRESIMRELLEQSGVDLSSSISMPESSQNRFSNSSGRIKRVRKHLIRTPQMYDPLSTHGNSPTMDTPASSVQGSTRVTLSYSPPKPLPSSYTTS